MPGAYYGRVEPGGSQTTRVIALNHKVVSWYLVTALVLGAAALLYASLELHPRYVMLAVGAPAAVAVIVSPRLALFQFVFCCFIQYTILPSVPLELIDLSMALVIAAAALDLLSSDRLPKRLPRLSLNYVAIILALAVCGLLGYWPELAPRRIATTGLLFLTFLSIYRLSGRVSVGSLLRWYFLLAVAHSVYVLAPFVAAGGVLRSFGFAGVFFDDLAMVALPVGTALYVRAEGRAWPYLWGCLAVFGGLIATQARVAIVLALLASAFVLIVSWRRVSAEPGANNLVPHQTRRRIRGVVWSFVAAIAVVAVLKADLFVTVLERFEELLQPDPTGTTVYRLALWKRALVAFLDHPVFGVGPGGYYHLHQIYATLHLSPDYNYLRTLGAHSPMLHFLAELGILGGAALMALVVNHFRLARGAWRQAPDGVTVALYGWGLLFMVSMVIEAGWMWGPASFPGILMAALVSRQYATTVAGEMG